MGVEGFALRAHMAKAARPTVTARVAAVNESKAPERCEKYG